MTFPLSIAAYRFLINKQQLAKKYSNEILDASYMKKNLNVKQFPQVLMDDIISRLS